jgi:hypothetical protein
VAARVHNVPAEAMAGLSQWSATAALDGETLTLTTASTSSLPYILRHLVESGADVFEFKPQNVSLEDQFLKIMGEDRGL